MSKTNQHEETMECNCKQLCIKMRNDSLRIAVSALKANTNNSNTILKILAGIRNSLKVYHCLPCSCLLQRIDYVCKNISIGAARLYPSEEAYVDMLISELNAFLNSNS